MKYIYQNKIIRIVASIVDFFGGIFFIFARLRNRDIDRDNIKKILVVKLDQLGDCFLSTPMFEHIHKAIPGVVVDLVCQESSLPIFKDNPFINNIFTFNYSRMMRGNGKRAGFTDYINLVHNLRQMDYDTFLDLRGEPFVAFLGFLVGARYKIGFGREEVGGFLYTYAPVYDRNSHETKKYEKILELLGVKDATWFPRIYIPEDEKKRFKDSIGLKIIKPFVAVHPGAGLSYKMWPIENFIELISKILSVSDLSVVLLGSPDEKIIGEEIEAKINNNKVLNLIGMISIRDAYELISTTEVFVGNDSVLAHFSGALDRPTVDIMNGVINENRWRPLGKKVIVLKGNDSEHVCKYDKCMYPCQNMKSVSIAEVLSNVERFL